MIASVRTFGLVALGALCAYGARHVFADGIPASDPLYYAGYLTENGEPVNATRDLAIRLWPNAQAAPGESALCSTDVGNTSIVEGRFRVPLSQSCAQAIRQRSDTYVEVVVDTDLSLGRAKIGAVPYAIEAERAGSASSARGALLEQLVPSGAVMAFDLANCPPGYTEYASARGRALVGASGDLALGSMVGEAQHTLQTAELPPHSHTITVFNPTGASVNGDTDLRVHGGRQEPSSYGTSSPSHLTGEGQPFTNMQPSLAVLYCRKN